MKIAIINNLYEPFERGGAERIAKLQFEGFKRKGASVITISLKPFGSQVIKSKNHYYISSVFPNLNKFPKFLRLFWHFWDFINLINYFKIKKILKINNIDIVITHNITGMGKLIVPHLSKNYKHMHVLHDIALLHPSGLMYYRSENIVNSLFAHFFQNLNLLFFNNIKFVISPSTWLLKIHQEHKMFRNCKSFVVPNPVNSKKIKKTVTNDDAFVFLYVGIISKAKGVDILLDAFLKLSDDNKIKLILIGPEKEKDILRSIKKNSSIHYIGEKKHDVILDNMQNANCLIMPSSCYENSPTVIYEAMSQALAVISSEIGGAKEIVERFGGFLFNPTDGMDLQDKMSYVIKNPTKIKRIAEESMIISKIYNLESYILKIEKIVNHQESRLS